MAALLLLLLIFAVFGGLGFVAHAVWVVLIAAVVIWLIASFVGGLGSVTASRRGVEGGTANGESFSAAAIDVSV